MRVGAILASVAFLYAFQAPKFVITPDAQAAIDHIRADSMRGDLSFIASDLLEGRDTPSRGLDVAAEYIAAQFRRAGLEPGGDDGYFQTAQMATVEPSSDGFDLKLSDGEHTLTAGAKDVLITAITGLDLKDAPVFKLDLANPPDAEALNGKVVITELTRGPSNAFRMLREAKPALLITVARKGPTGRMQPRQLVDPADPSRAIPRIFLVSEAAATFYDSLKPGTPGALASVHLPPPHETPVTPRNVIGILRGSDAALKDTYVLVTAHYDHLGMPRGAIYNGANDDGSGTVSVIEIARALASMKQRPRRSIAFMTFFGEEKGLVGSSYYAHHPTFPVEKIVAQLNLEQLGRTDSSEGPQIANAAFTGFDYSTVTDFVLAAGDLTGINVYKHPRNNDIYFAASDNLPLAQAGVPAHSLGVTFQFPDYHGLGDKWQKIDYENMAKVDRMVALSVLMLANSAEAPHWNEQNPSAAPYVKAWKERRLPAR